VYYPTSLWKPGEVLLDRHQLTVPPDAPPGPYELFAGMYELVGQEARTIGSRLLSGRVGGEAQPQTPQTAPARPTYANFNDEILLIGYDVAGGRLVALDGRPQTASQDVPPDEVRIQLLWQAAQPMSRDYTVFVHLVDPAAGIVAQLDAQPFDGDYPTSVWQQGELLTDTLVVQLPRELQPGEYTIMVGLYDAGTASQSRLPAYDDGGQRLSNDRVSLVQISLE
jgi:hypothetical protein